MKKELKFKLELGKLYKWFIVFMCFFGIILSIYLFFTPVYIQENPKLTYLCPIAVVLCIVGLFYPFKYKIKVFTTSVEYNNVFTNKIIDFNQVNKLRLSNYRTLRVVGNETKIELTNDLRNQKEAIRFIIYKVVNEQCNVEFLHFQYLSDWFNENEINDLKNKIGLTDDGNS